VLEPCRSVSCRVCADTVYTDLQDTAVLQFLANLIVQIFTEMHSLVMCITKLPELQGRRAQAAPSPYFLLGIARQVYASIICLLCSSVVKVKVRSTLDLALLFCAKLPVANSKECVNVTILLKSKSSRRQAHLITTWHENQCNKLCKLQTARQCQT